MEYRVDWVAKYGKIGEKYPFWAFLGDMYRYTLNMYQYMLGSCHFGPTCTGTCDALFPISISFLILTITCSFRIRFE